MTAFQITRLGEGPTNSGQRAFRVVGTPALPTATASAQSSSVGASDSDPVAALFAALSSQAPSSPTPGAIDTARNGYVPGVGGAMYTPPPPAPARAPTHQNGQVPGVGGAMYTPPPPKPAPAPVYSNGYVPGVGGGR